MSDGQRLPQAIPYDRWFPWLRLFRALPIALNIKMIVMAMLGVLFLKAGWGVIDNLLGDDAKSGFAQSVGGVLPSALPPGIVAGWESRASSIIAEPIRVFWLPFEELLAINQGPQSFFHGFAAMIWMMLVWSIFGFALGRMAAVRAIEPRSERFWGALGYAIRRWPITFMALLSPLIGISIFGFLSAGIGLVGSFSTIAEGVLFGFALICGWIMAILLIGWLASWPTMIMAISIDGEDQFEALSRGYHYVFQRPVRFLAYWALAALIGCLFLILLSAFVGLMTHMAHWGIAWGMNDSDVLQLAKSQNSPIHAAWLSAIDFVIYSSVFAYFWVASAFIYLLLRLDVDGAAWNELHYPNSVSQPEPFVPEVQS